MTLAVAAVLRVFLEDADQSRYGYDLMRHTGFASGKLYPILARLERCGWLVKEVEDIDPATARRPVRRLYRLSAEGAAAARIELAGIGDMVSLPVPMPARRTGGPEAATA